MEHIGSTAILELRILSYNASRFGAQLNLLLLNFTGYFGVVVVVYLKLTILFRYVAHDITEKEKIKNAWVRVDESVMSIVIPCLTS
jgi:hypothetical protein